MYPTRLTSRCTLSTELQSSQNPYIAPRELRLSMSAYPGLAGGEQPNLNCHQDARATITMGAIQTNRAGYSDGPVPLFCNAETLTPTPRCQQDQFAVLPLLR